MSYCVLRGVHARFLDGSAGTSQQWLDRVASVVDDLAQNRKFVLVDGVGFPAVGSICGTSNADVAKRLEAPAVLVVKAGVGAAIDEANYGTAFFGSRDVPVLGVVLNRSASQGFYAREKILAPVHAYFAKTSLGLYGIIPDEPSLTNLRNEAASKDIDTAPGGSTRAEARRRRSTYVRCGARPWNSRRRRPLFYSNGRHRRRRFEDAHPAGRGAAGGRGRQREVLRRRVKSFFPLCAIRVTALTTCGGAGPVLCGHYFRSIGATATTSAWTVPVEAAASRSAAAARSLDDAARRWEVYTTERRWSGLAAAAAGLRPASRPMVGP